MTSRRLSRLQNVATTKLQRRLDAVCMLGLKMEKEDCCVMSDHFYMPFVQVSFVLGE